MKIEWTKKDVPLTTAMIERVTQRAEGFQQRFPDEDFSLRISLIQNKGNKRNHSYRLKGILSQGGLVISAESRELDYYDAVDAMMDTLLHNYKKERNKRERQNRQARRELKEYFKPTIVDEFDDYEYEFEEDYEHESGEE